MEAMGDVSVSTTIYSSFRNLSLNNLKIKEKEE
jgi:hypothetical protein